MTISIAPDVQAMIAARMASGNYHDENDLLRTALESLQQSDDDWQAVKQALDEVERGDEEFSLDETFAAIRSRHGLHSDD